MAKPLPKQENIDKGKVWTVFIGGAASLFLVTVAAENNKSWFPAIARANEAMALARKRAEQVWITAVCTWQPQVLSSYVQPSAEHRNGRMCEVSLHVLLKDLSNWLSESTLLAVLGDTG